MHNVTLAPDLGKHNPFSPDFVGYPDELPAAVADYAIPFADDDQWIETGLDDPDYGDPAEWPEWTDAHWLEPTDADVEFLNRNAYGSEPFEPTDADWDEVGRWCEHLDRLDALSREENEAEAQAEARNRYAL